MGVLQKIYLAVMQKQTISFPANKHRTDYQGCEGTLSVYLSEHKSPGQCFIVFHPHDKETSLKTSPGILTIENDLLTLQTHQGANCYIFQIQKTLFDMLLHFTSEKFLHVCEVCGRRELLSSQEAILNGWQYPPTHGMFRVISPRICGSCHVTDTLYWKLYHENLDMNSLTDIQLETMKQIKGEPFNLFPSDNTPEYEIDKIDKNSIKMH